MPPRKRRIIPEEIPAYKYSEFAYFNNPTVSSTECTGITPVIPRDITEADSYSDIMNIPVTSLDDEQAEGKAE